MSQKQTMKWSEKSYEERICQLELFFNDTVLFSTKLLNDYLEQMKMPYVKEKENLKKILEDAFADRMMELQKELALMHKRISSNQSRNASFLQPLTDFGRMEHGVSE